MTDEEKDVCQVNGLEALRHGWCGFRVWLFKGRVEKRVFYCGVKEIKGTWKNEGNQFFQFIWCGTIGLFKLLKSG